MSTTSAPPFAGAFERCLRHRGRRRDRMSRPTAIRRGSNCSDVRPADRVSALLVELVGVHAAHVVGLEDTGVERHAVLILGCAPRRARTERSELATRARRPRASGASRTRCSGMTLTSASTGMKFVSPAQRGTTCRWTWSMTPAPATRPRFQPRLKPCGLIWPAQDVDARPRRAGEPRAPRRPELAELAAVAVRRHHQRARTAYGNLLRRTKASSPRWTMSALLVVAAGAVQKTHPVCSSAARTYSRRQGAQSRRVISGARRPSARERSGSEPLLPAEEPDHGRRAPRP